MDGSELARGRTYLDTSDGLGEYAKNCGAQYDKHRCEWYVVGEVPHELLNLVPKPARGRAPPIVAPSCPVCGYHMKVVKGIHGPFFGCSQYVRSGCKGSINYDKYLDSIGMPLPMSVGNILEPRSLPNGSASPPAKKEPQALHPDLQLAIKEVENLCLAEFSSKPELERWLNAPKRALDGKSPLGCLSTIDGCNKVNHLLRSRWD